MAAVTEIAVLHLKTGVDPEVAAQKVAALVLQQPGALCARHSTKHEDREQLALFIDWDSLSAHKTFMGTPAYEPFLEDIGELIRASPAIYHVPFVPFPPTVLNNKGGQGKTAVAEVVYGFFPVDLDIAQEQEILTHVQQFIDESQAAKPKGFSGESAHGFVLEDMDFKGEQSRALMLILGWDSVESHMAYRDTKDFARTIPLLRTLPGLKGMQMWHVSNSEAHS